MKLQLAVFSLLFMLSACAYLGLAQPQSTTERIAYANSQLTGMAETSALAVRQGRINIQDARHLSEVAKECSAMLDLATLAVQDNDEPLAQSRLALVTNMLTAMERFLQAKESK